MHKQVKSVIPPLDQVTSSVVITEHAAHYLLRKPQTLRIWAFSKSGPVLPIRVHGRLCWPVDQIREALGVQKVEINASAD